MKKQKRIASGLMGTMLLAGSLSGCSSVEQTSLEAPIQETASIGGLASAGPTALPQTAYAVSVGKKVIEIPASAITAEFTFSQDVLSPDSDVFNMYGTALTGVCAKPAFAMEEGKELAGDYYVNISGHVQKNCQIGLRELEYKEQHKIAACTCATGPGIVNAQITGIRLADLLELAGLAPEANTVTARSFDGYGIPIPLQYALEKESMLVYQINGQELPPGQGPQLWVPGAVASYFTRNVAEIELTVETELPPIEASSEKYKAKIGLLNHMDETVPLGRTLLFEGYADDCESPIQAIEFSMDGGQTWLSCETPGASAEKWVYWQFSYRPEEAGQFELQVRARTCDGAISPLSAILTFHVGEEDR